MDIVGILRGEINVVDLIKKEKIINRLNSKNVLVN